MIQIRRDMFETNSSSSHAFFIKDDVKIRIPETINYSDFFSGYNTDANTFKEKLSLLYQLAERNNKTDEFINYLRSKGITIINDRKTSEYDSHMFEGIYMSENMLDKFLFGEDSIYRDTPEYDTVLKLEKQGYKVDYYNY